MTDPAKLHIRHYPDPALRRRAEPLERVDDQVRAVADRMIELMHEAEGVGLAAPQVGLPWRLFVARGIEEGDEPEIFINPRLEMDPGESLVAEEGCLSLPGVTGEVRRSAGVTMIALDREGRTMQRRAEGFIARVWQHEFDHLEGVLIIDRMNQRDRMAVRKALRAME